MAKVNYGGGGVCIRRSVSPCSTNCKFAPKSTFCLAGISSCSFASLCRCPRMKPATSGCEVFWRGRRHPNSIGFAWAGLR